MINQTLRDSLITDAEITAFQRDSAVCLRQVFPVDWMEKIARGIERNLADPGPNSENLGDGGGKFFNDYCNWRSIPEFTDYVYRSPAAEIAARLMRSSQAIFYHEHILIKEPGATRPTPWHHDQPYYPVDGAQLCSIWMPIDPAPLASSLCFVKGSHGWGRWFTPRKFATLKNYQAEDEGCDLSRYETLPDIDGQPERYEILSWALEPGDCVVFHGLTLHGAAGNASRDTSRRVIATRWFGDDARFARRPWAVSPPVTGGLQPGQSMACAEFPLIWRQAS